MVSTAKKLMNKRGTMKTTSRVRLYTGMTPGLLLYNLKSLGFMEKADLVYGGLMNLVISPAGEFAEAYDHRDRWLDYGPPPTVYRTWETAINVEAVLYYITGLRYDHRSDTATLQPHLPPGVDRVRFDNLYAGGHRLSVLLTRGMDSTIDIDVTNSGDGPVKIELITEPVAGVEPPEAAVVFESAAYRRTLWRQTRTLAPGEHFRAPGGTAL